MIASNKQGVYVLSGDTSSRVIHSKESLEHSHYYVLGVIERSIDVSPMSYVGYDDVFNSAEFILCRND